MGRLINPDNPGKRRNQQMRTCAELLRHLTQQNGVNDNSKNMLAMLVLSLKDIADGIDESTVAWEKRDYWVKAEEFRERWRWTTELGAELSNIIFEERWDDVPAILIKLFPYFSDIKVTKLTRNETLWHDAYDRLLEQNDAD
jgi:hypothetical protein